MEKKVKKAPWLYVVSFFGVDVAAYTSALACVALWRLNARRDAHYVKVRRYRCLGPDSIEVVREDITEIIRKAI